MTRFLQTTVLMPFLVAALPLAGADLSPSRIEYLGYFKAPDDLKWWNGIATHVPGCMGRVDPSPGDGYPGCLLAKKSKEVALIDIVSPSATGDAQPIELMERYDVTAGYPMSEYPDIYDGKREGLYDLYVVEGPQCRIHWWYIGNYANAPKVGDPVYGISDCDTENPTVLGMWPLYIDPKMDKDSDNPYHPNIWTRGLGRVPQEIADAHFDGHAEAFISGKQTGTRGSSSGPSIAVRTEPSFSIPAGEQGVTLSPLVYYRSTSGGYPRWYEPTEFHTTDGRDFTIDHRGIGGEVVSSPQGSAFVHPMRRPKFCAECYPANDPDAGPTKVDEKYRDHPEKYPNPDHDVVTWYGEENCQRVGSEPKFHDRLADGTRTPFDCDIADKNPGRICQGGRGPHGLNYHTDLVMYSVADLAAVYAGEREPWTVLPYAEVDITPDLSGDGYNEEDYCIGEPIGTAYDQASNRLYVGYGGKISFVQVFKIGGDEQRPFCGDGTCNPDENVCSCPQDCGAPPAEDCADGNDNDCDGLVDSEDEDCVEDAAIEQRMTLEGPRSEGSWLF